MICVSCNFHSSKGWCCFSPWVFSRVESPSSQWGNTWSQSFPYKTAIAGSLAGSGVWTLSGLRLALRRACCKLGQSQQRYLIDRVHLELSTHPCGHGAHCMLRTGDSWGCCWLQQGVQTPYIFKPKGHCRNLLCGLSSTTLLVGVVLVLLACLQEELCGLQSALWCLCRVTRTQLRWARKSWFQVKPEHLGGQQVLVLAAHIVRKIGDKWQPCWRSDAWKHLRLDFCQEAPLTGRVGKLGVPTPEV